MNCSKCNKPRHKTDKECPYCGVIFGRIRSTPKPKPPEKKQPETQKKEHPPSKLTKCSACEQEISKNATACPHCGEPLKKATPKQINRKSEVCTHCGYIGRSKKVTRGHFLTEVVLWCFFLFPGLLYSFWRLSGAKILTCPKCKAIGMIPTNSPVGNKIINHQNTTNTNETKDNKDTNKFRFSTASTIAFIVIFGFSASLISIYSDNKTSPQKYSGTNIGKRDQENKTTETTSSVTLHRQFTTSQISNSNQQAEDLLWLMAKYKNKTVYNLIIKENKELTAIKINLPKATLSRIHQQQNGGTIEEWQEHILERLNAAKNGEGFNRTKSGKSPGFFESFDGVLITLD